MPSADIKLPRSQRVIFPQRCIVCGELEPARKTRVRRTSSTLWSALFPFLHLVSLFDGHTVHVPACSGCGWKLHAQAWWRWLAMIAILIVFVWFGTEVVAQWVPKKFLKWAMLGGAFVVLAPWFIWQVVFPLPFDMTVAADEITYEFRDEQTARDFFVVNSTDDPAKRQRLLGVIAMRDRLSRADSPAEATGHPYQDLHDPRFDQ